MKPIAVIYLWCRRGECQHVVSARQGDVADRALAEHDVYKHRPRTRVNEQRAALHGGPITTPIGGA